ncbi:MAG: hypothetical protein CMC76_09735 [Flavobacteriaceae bacterium]|nr:hypothetical protein [Flavobacteriaceae bacterium]|tara:strand:- start:2401 stop:3096 length:696 start_codon:yes stop_codon:yes gene_type:complete
MDVVIPVFQFEIRYSRILNFSQIGRTIIAPYGKLTENINVDKQNTVEETYFLNFEEEGYLMMFSWDRAVFKGQGSLDTYLQRNSPLSTLFFDIFKYITQLKEFGKITRSLFYGVSVAQYSQKKNALETYAKNILTFDPAELDNNFDDIAVIIESNTESGSKSITFGPYFGPDDIFKRLVKPININALGDISFEGLILEYKRVKIESHVNFDTFIQHCTEFQQTFKSIWKKQ